MMGLDALWVDTLPTLTEEEAFLAGTLGPESGFEAFVGAKRGALAGFKSLLNDLGVSSKIYLSG